MTGEELRRDLADLELQAGCGLRLGEATGLTVDRVDFLRRQLTVDRQMLPIGDLEFGPPKTERSYRKVPLADVVVAELVVRLCNDLWS